MTFTADAKAKYSEAKPSKVETDERGVQVAALLSEAIDRPVDFLEYLPSGYPKLRVDDAIFHVMMVRKFDAESRARVTPSFTIRLTLARVCANQHTSIFAVDHEGLYDAGGTPTSRKQRNDFFLNEVGRALTENPACPTCKEAYA